MEKKQVFSILFFSLYTNAQANAGVSIILTKKTFAIAKSVKDPLECHSKIIQSRCFIFSVPIISVN